MTSDSAPLRSSMFLKNGIFLVTWTLANTLPWLSMWLVYQAWPISGLAWFVACVLVGIAQWLVLQRHIANIDQWALATCLGGIVGFSGFATYVFAMFVTPPLCGLAVGIAQWLVLRRKLTGAFWWIVATTVGALAGIVMCYPFSALTGGLYSAHLEQIIFSLGIVVEVTSSIITGLAMLWLLKRNANRKVVNTQPNESLESGA